MTRPSVVRILALDPLARLLAFFFLMGAVLLAAIVYSQTRPPPTPGPAELLESALSGRSTPPPRDRDTEFLLLGAVCLLGFPVRILLLRAFFARANEVKGVISNVPRTETQLSVNLLRSQSSTVIQYDYTFRGERCSAVHRGPLSLWRRYVDRIGGEVVVLVDPFHPRRTALKEIWFD